MTNFFDSVLVWFQKETQTLKSQAEKKKEKKNETDFFP